ncbi:DUF3289 family protein [Erwinia sp. HDF1-3R]|uniref:DUF3289 family protein n=1 Tax=Erwinia sp. HDF1-3R TaxID=3141543 RepID=UPI0031F4F413
MRCQFGAVPVALDNAVIICGCPPGSNRLIARAGKWFGPGEPPHAYEPMHVVLARMNGGTDVEQHAQAAKKQDKPDALPLPARIYTTQRVMDDYDAKDMHHGDLDVLTLRNTFRLNVDEVSMKVNPSTLKLKDPADPFAFSSPYVHPDFQPKPMPTVSRKEAAGLMFDEFRELAKMFSFQGEYKHVITEMITHMEGNSGKPYSSPLLDRALKAQILNDHSVQSSLLSIKNTLHKTIDYNYGYIPLGFESSFRDGILNECVVLPKFNRVIDNTNGLVISVHDTWSTHITLASLEVTGDSYRAKVHYRVQDHFGLDDTDVKNELFRQFRIFRLWFVLQRWDEYGYKPFITEMNATVEISGVRGE